MFVFNTVLYCNVTASHHLKIGSKTSFNNMTQKTYFTRLATIAWHPHTPLSVTLRCTIIETIWPSHLQMMAAVLVALNFTLKWRSHHLFLLFQLHYLTLQFLCCHFGKASAILMFYGHCYPWGSM